MTWKYEIDRHGARWLRFHIRRFEVMIILWEPGLEGSGEAAEDS